MNAAQDAYARILAGADVCLMLSSMLHSIAAANMIPSRVLTVCVDIHPPVVTKLQGPRLAPGDRRRHRRRALPPPAGGRAERLVS